MNNKKHVVSTPERLRVKSELAISAFRNLVNGLKTTNEEANAAQAANEKKISQLEQENIALELLTSQNEKIIQNVESLLSVE